ncbi:hypothetical protein [Priestia taiwanensis]|uniref:Uncharacterized protein n=1 Tax=Priestia taiwanensis TaxID=1347902 RepID=A0A917AKQ2_9BACI|nr:hypothetical protein [Priestia taiwanensis]MBM7362003.1 hypothetical protein [Priestia taiwanensis]GGE58668.1 hypothetical protein GCM10007140_06280 [Priestia taiwanensis]
MILVYVIDENGYFIETQTIEEKEIVIDKHITFAWSEGMFRPKYDFVSKQWKEDMTQAEIDAALNTPPTPTPEQIMKKYITALELKLLGLQSEVETLKNGSVQ